MTGSVQRYKCRRCGDSFSSDEPLPTCSRGPCPMEPVSITVYPPKDSTFEVRMPPAPERGEGVTLDDAGKAFWDHVKRQGILPQPERAAQALSRAEMIAVYDAMKSEDILANVEPGDHGNAILEAYGRRVIAAAIEKAQAGGKA